ncbi:hypothetical protein G7Y79_00001g003300 [Physcia stellaris]|nr:hypothetical protein G7Y79_00001g003300 [Physcia stellaris]
MKLCIILILARRFVYTATGDEDDSAWQSIATMINDKFQPERYAKGRLWGIYRTKKMYGEIEKDEHPEIVHLMTKGAHDAIVKRKMQQHGL